jgi:holliday junction DNA helicase RuvA
MYSFIKGKLVHKEAALLVVETGGIGYEIKVSPPTAAALQLDELCHLYTYLHITENSHTLYGFIDYDNRKLFLQLISVSGVGPNTGMVIVSSLSAIEIREAIVKEDLRTLQSIKGIGSKTAQQIVLDLKDKMKKEDLLDAATPLQNKVGGFYQNTSTKQEALAALITLGIAKPTAEKSIEAVFKKYGKDLKVEEIIRYALKNN